MSVYVLVNMILYLPQCSIVLKMSYGLFQSHWFQFNEYHIVLGSNRHWFIRRCGNIIVVPHFTFFQLLLLSKPKQGFNKGHVEVYRAAVDELLQFHQLKWNFNHLDRFYLKVWKFPRFSMHECNAHIDFLPIYILKC
jgi:hypothetical protein